MVIYLVAIFSMYFIFLLLCLYGWSKQTYRIDSVPANDLRFVSVIVPMRNEELNLPALLNSLLLQDFDRHRWEVILVNDHSSDQSVAIISDWIKNYPLIKARLLSAHGNGKKNAITEAIQSAHGDIIMTTDADCHLPSNWISVMSNSFDSNSEMVAGAVKINANNGFFSRLQAMEFSSLLGSGLAMLKLGFPVFCNGASLAYLKSAFNEVGGYEDNLHIASGDDEFLMRKLNKRFPRGLKTIVDFTATVSTEPQSTISDFFHQRIRWAGKWKTNESWGTKLLAVFILVFQISFIAALFYIFMGEPSCLVIALCVIKMVLEGLFLFQVSKGLAQRFSLSSFLVLQLLYPIYVIFIGVTSQFVKALWKERQLSL